MCARSLYLFYSGCLLMWLGERDSHRAETKSQSTNCTSSQAHRSPWIACELLWSQPETAIEQRPNQKQQKWIQNPVHMPAIVSSSSILRQMSIRPISCRCVFQTSRWTKVKSPARSPIGSYSIWTTSEYKAIIFFFFVLKTVILGWLETLACTTTILCPSVCRWS